MRPAKTLSYILVVLSFLIAFSMSGCSKEKHIEKDNMTYDGYVGKGSVPQGQGCLTIKKAYGIYTINGTFDGWNSCSDASLEFVGNDCNCPLNSINSYYVGSMKFNGNVAIDGDSIMLRNGSINVTSSGPEKFSFSSDVTKICIFDDSLLTFRMPTLQTTDCSITNKHILKMKDTEKNSLRVRFQDGMTCMVMTFARKYVDFKKAANYFSDGMFKKTYNTGEVFCGNFVHYDADSLEERVLDETAYAIIEILSDNPYRYSNGNTFYGMASIKGFSQIGQEDFINQSAKMPEINIINGYMVDTKGDTAEYQDGKKLPVDIYQIECNRYGKKYVDAIRRGKILVGTPLGLFERHYRSAKLDRDSGNKKSYDIYKWEYELGFDDCWELVRHLRMSVDFSNDTVEYVRYY